MSRELGITEIKLQELNNYKSSSLFSSEEQAVLRYADAVTSTPTEIPDEIFSHYANILMIPKSLNSHQQ